MRNASHAFGFAGGAASASLGFRGTVGFGGFGRASLARSAGFGGRGGSGSSAKPYPTFGLSAIAILRSLGPVPTDRGTPPPSC